MAQLADRLQIILGLDISQLNGQMNQVKSKSNGLVSFLKDAFSFTLGVGMFDAIKTGIKAVGELSIGFNASMEQNMVAFKAMLGSGEKAKQLLTWITNYSAKTPFQTQDLADSAKMLMALGMEAKKIPTALKSITDMTAYVGGDSDKMNRISYALGEMLTSGTVTSMRMRELTNNSVPAWDLLSKAIGKTTAQTKDLVEKGAVPAKQAVDALLAGMEKRAKDMAVKQSATFKGLITTLKDNVSIAAGKVGYDAFKKLEGAIGDVVKKAKTFTETFTKSGIKDAIYSILPEEVASRIVGMGEWINNNLVPVLKDLGNNVLRVLSGAIDSLTSSSSDSNGVVQLFTGSLNLLNDALGWLADHQGVLNAIVQLLVVKFIGGLVASVTGTLVGNIASLTTAIGTKGLAGAMGELLPFAASNPILAVAVGISGVIIGSIVTYTEKIREMKNEAKALQDLVKNGIMSEADYKKATSTSSEAKKQLAARAAAKKIVPDATDKKDTSYYEELQRIKNLNPDEKHQFDAVNKNKKTSYHDYALYLAKKLGVTNYDKNTSMDELAELARIEFRHNQSAISPKMQMIEQKKFQTKDWFNNNGFYGKSDKQIQAFLKKMDAGEAFYKKLQDWQEKSIKGETFSKSETADMKKIENGILKVNKERANLIKNKPAILKNKNLIGLSQLPYKALNKAQKKQVDEYNKALKIYNNKIKLNSKEYTFYGTTLSYKDTVLKDIKDYLKPKAKTTVAKVTDPNKILQEYIEKQAKAKQSLAKKIKAVKSTYAEQIQNFINDAKENLAGNATSKKLYKALYDKSEELKILNKEYTEMSKVDPAAANIIYGQIGSTTAEITSIKDKIKNLNAKNKNAAAKAKAKTAKTNAKSFTQKLKDGIANSTASLSKFLNGNGLKIDAFLNDLKLNPENVLKDYDGVVNAYNQDLSKTQKDKAYYQSLLKGTTTKADRAIIQAKINALEKQESDITKKIQDAKTEQVQQLKAQYDRDKGVQADMLIKWTGLLVDSLTGDVKKNKALIQGIKQPSPVLNTSFNTNNNVSLTEGAVAAGVIKALKYLGLNNPSLNIDIAGAGISTIATVQNAKLAGHR